MLASLAQRQLPGSGSMPVTVHCVHPPGCDALQSRPSCRMPPSGGSASCAKPLQPKSSSDFDVSPVVSARVVQRIETGHGALPLDLSGFHTLACELSATICRSPDPRMLRDWMQGSGLA